MRKVQQHLIRFVCTKHDCDLEPTLIDGNGNPEGPLFRIRYDEDFGGTKSPHDHGLALVLGIIDENDNVLKPGVWYVLDTSNFACPKVPEQPEGQTAEEEDRWYEEVYCAKYWHFVVEMNTLTVQ